MVQIVVILQRRIFILLDCNGFGDTNLVLLWGSKLGLISKNSKK
jgi:hypothetical protein